MSEQAPGPAARRRPLPPIQERGTLRLVADQGGPGCCYFAINNACNACCRFCGFSLDTLPRRDWRFVETAGALDALHILYANGIRYLVLFGGEPLLHPDVDRIAGRAKALGMTVLLISNGALLRPRRVRELAAAGVGHFILSVDAASAELHEKNRGLPGLCDRIRAANRAIAQLGLSCSASVTMSRLVDYEALPGFLRELGFESVSFSYPITTLGSSFLAFSDSELVKYSREEWLEIFDRVKEVKRHIRVSNPSASLEEMKRFARGEAQRFECLGGQSYFHLDWNLDVWRCHFWDEPMCNIYDFDESRRIRDGCTRCTIDCYRDSSLLQTVALSTHDAYRALRRGRLGDAARALAQRKNLSSIGALLEEFSHVATFAGLSRRRPRQSVSST